MENTSQTNAESAKPAESPEKSCGHEKVQFPSDASSINVDHVMEHVVKPCGLWQWSVVLLLACSSCSLVTFPVYANSASRHRCALEPHIEDYIRDYTNLTFPQIAAQIGPWFGRNSSLAPSQFGCFRFQFKWRNLTESDLDTLFKRSPPEAALSNSLIEACPHGYVFEHSRKHYPQNVVREFETVCHRSWLVPFGTSVFMCGMSMGFLSGGWCAGKFGRRWTVLVCALCEVLSAVWTSLSPNYVSYILSRAAGAIFGTAKNSVAGVLVIELTVARYRSIFKAIQTLGLAFFHRSLLSLWAYYVPNWRWLNALAMGPSILALAHIFLLPESPRWLLSKNRTTEAMQVLKKGYHINHLRKTKPDFQQLIMQMQAIAAPEKSDSTTNTLNQSTSTHETQRAVLIRTTILSVLIMFGVTLSFTGILFYARIVRDYVYIVGFLNSLMALPGTVLFMLLYRYFARRKYPLLTLCATAGIILAISALYTLIVQPENDVLLTIGSNVSFVLVLASLCMGNLYVPELFPSLWRTQGLGLVMGLARIGGIICSFVNELDRIVMHGTPMLIYSIVLGCVSIGLLFLPDTKGENLPDR